MKFLSGEVKWGIIGCGDVCEVKSGPGFQKASNSELVAVMRRDGLKARDFAMRHGVARYYDDPDQLIGDEEVNAIYIATPPLYHEEYTFRALRAGKPVYVEKPVAINGAACQRMIDMVKTFRVPVSCAHYRRALPLFRKVKEIIRGGRLGKVRLINLQLLQAPTEIAVAPAGDNWRTVPAISGGGYFHDLAPHQLDILYWIFGEPLEMKGRSLNQGKLYGAPDVTTLEVVFSDDVLFQGLWAFDVNLKAAEEGCKIIGEEGFVSFSFFKHPVLELITRQGSERFEFPYPVHIQQPMISEVIRYFKGEQDNPCSLEDALVGMKMMDCTL